VKYNSEFHDGLGARHLIVNALSRGLLSSLFFCLITICD